MSETEGRPLTRRELRELERQREGFPAADPTPEAALPELTEPNEAPAPIDPPTGTIPLVDAEGRALSRRELRALWAAEAAGTAGEAAPAEREDDLESHPGRNEGRRGAVTDEQEPDFPISSVAADSSPEESNLLDTQAMSFDDLLSAGVAESQAKAQLNRGAADEADAEPTEGADPAEAEETAQPASAGRGLKLPWGRKNRKEASEVEETADESAAGDAVEAPIPTETHADAAAEDMEPAGDAAATQALSFEELLAESAATLEGGSAEEADARSQSPSDSLNDEGTQSDASEGDEELNDDEELSADTGLSDDEVISLECGAQGTDPDDLAADASEQVHAVPAPEVSVPEELVASQEAAFSQADLPGLAELEQEIEEEEESEIVLPEYSFPDIQPLEEERSVFDDPSTSTMATISDPLLGTQIPVVGGDFDDLISRAVAAEGSGGVNTAALILPAMPDSAEIAGPLNETGEIFVTGSIELPKSLGETGGHARLFDTIDPAEDALQEDLGAFERSPSDGTAPMSATRAISAQSSNNAIVTPPTSKGNKLPLILSLSGGGLLVAVVGLFVYGATSGMFG